MARYTTLLFDFDGTTANTTPGIIHCVQKVLHAEGIFVDDQTIISHAGNSVFDAIKKISGNDNDAEVARYAERYSELYAREGLQMTEAYPMVLETIERLHQRGISMAMASNNARAVVVPMIERLGLLKYMDTVVCIDDVERGKPAPDIALEAIRRIGSTPEQTLIVGDTAFDVGMGTAAGIAVCGVTHGDNTQGKLMEAGASYIINSFDELLKIIFE